LVWHILPMAEGLVASRIQSAQCAAVFRSISGQPARCVCTLGCRRLLVFYRLETDVLSASTSMDAIRDLDVLRASLVERDPILVSY
jgi:hypothetical protein